MPCISKFLSSLNEHIADKTIIEQIVKGHESITDKSSKKKKTEFFTHAMRVMDELLDYQTRYEIIDPCACCKGGWREKAAKKIKEEYADKGLEERLQALGQVKWMGNPILNDDGTITASIGINGGFSCPCTVLDGCNYEEPISLTYCLCCGGHFRHHYQIALGKKLRTKAVISSALESVRKKPCRFVYEIVDK
jgi:hypothetical protein